MSWKRALLYILCEHELVSSSLKSGEMFDEKTFDTTRRPVHPASSPDPPHPRTLSVVFLPMAPHQAPNLRMPASPDTGRQAGEPWASSQACAFLYPLQVGHRLCWQKLVQILLTSQESTHSKISISSKKLKMGNRF